MSEQETLYWKAYIDEQINNRLSSDNMVGFTFEQFAERYMQGITGQQMLPQTIFREFLKEAGKSIGAALAQQKDVIEGEIEEKVYDIQVWSGIISDNLNVLRITNSTALDELKTAGIYKVRCSANSAYANYTMGLLYVSLTAAGHIEQVLVINTDWDGTFNKFERYFSNNVWGSWNNRLPEGMFLPELVWKVDNSHNQITISSMSSGTIMNLFALTGTGSGLAFGKNMTGIGSPCIVHLKSGAATSDITGGDTLYLGAGVCCFYKSLSSPTRYVEVRTLDGKGYIKGVYGSSGLSWNMVEMQMLTITAYMDDTQKEMTLYHSNGQQLLLEDEAYNQSGDIYVYKWFNDNGSLIAYSVSETPQTGDELYTPEEVEQALAYTYGGSRVTYLHEHWGIWKVQ